MFVLRWCFLLCGTIGLVAGDTESANSNPLQQTLEFIQNLQKSIVKDGEDEQGAYRKYFDWCSESAMTATQSIKELTRTCANLNSEISEATSDFDDSVSHIDELTTTISENDAQLKEAQDMRKKENADFKATEEQLMETMDMLGRAIEVLQKNVNKKVSEASLMQQSPGIPLEVVQTLGVVVEAAGIDVESKEKLTALLQQGSQADDESLGAPDGESGEAYTAHTADIVELMTNMRTKASDQLREAREGETKAQHNFELVEQTLKDQTQNAKVDLEKEKKDKAEAAQRKATAEGDLAQATSQLEAAKTSKKNIQTSCMQTAADHESSVKNREEELSKLKEALSIIQQNVGAAADHTYSFVQTSATSSMGVSQRLAAKEVISIVKRLAGQQHSKRLAQMASRMSAIMKYGEADGADPFIKVKELIRTMISKMMKEAAADVKEKEYCDAEMKKTQSRKDDLTDEVKDLKVKIDKAASDSTILKRDVKDLQRELADLAKEQAEMDAARAKMHEVYLATKADLQKGLNGLHAAMRVLKQYYGDAESAAALVQTSDSSESDSDQPTVDNHEKASTAGSSIIGLLEVVEGDIAKNLARVETEEDAQQAEYDKLTQENKITKVQKEKDVEFKVKGYDGLDKSIAGLTTDMTTSKEELEAVEEYWKKLKERCLGTPEKYAERKARRAAEIKGLKEAKAMLDGSNVPVGLLVKKSFLKKREIKGHDEDA